MHWSSIGTVPVTTSKEFALAIVDGVVGTPLWNEIRRIRSTIFAARMWTYEYLCDLLWPRGGMTWLMGRYDVLSTQCRS
jgi:hypothetical protein